MTLRGARVGVIGAGYSGKRRVFERLAALGVRAVVVDEPGHWSESLVTNGLADAWVSAPVTGDADADAAAVLDTLRRGGIRVDGVLTYWEDSVSVAARVAAALGLPGNSPQSVDSARSKVRMREVSAELGLPTPAARRVQSLDELYAAAAEIGFPAVVKPEFGASAMGCVRVDSFESLPAVYRLVRDVVRPETDGIFRAGNDLLLEEYLDGVEFDVDLVMCEGACLFSSVSQNWPTAEPSLQEKGLHCPPDHSRRAVRGLVGLSVQTARAFGLTRGVLHIEGKCTSRGPRIVEVNTRISLLNDYFDRNRTILVTTHQVEEIQDVLTDVMFIDRGRIVFDCSMDVFEVRYAEVMVNPEHVATARELRPIHERQVFGRSLLLFEDADRPQLAAMGEVRTPSIADLFVAIVGQGAVR
jgi:biotin carboxylase